MSGHFLPFPSLHAATHFYISLFWAAHDLTSPPSLLSTRLVGSLPLNGRRWRYHPGCLTRLTPLTAPLWTVCLETASFVQRYFLFLWLSPRNSPFELTPPAFPPRPLIFPSLPPADCHHQAGITPVSSHTSRHTGETCAGVKHGEGALLNLISQAGSH